MCKFCCNYLIIQKLENHYFSLKMTYETHYSEVPKNRGGGGGGVGGSNGGGAKLNGEGGGHVLIYELISGGGQIKNIWFL